jgi:hypothetical protein
VILIRPDGHIAFRFPSGQPGALTALDRHLSSYLIPDPTVGPVEEATTDLTDKSLERRQLPGTSADA